jgi:hypothetical protein
MMEDEKFHKENLLKMSKKYKIDISNLDAYLGDDIEDAMLKNGKFEKLIIQKKI